MQLKDLEYEKIGRALVGLYAAAHRANHDWVKSSAQHDVIPSDSHPEAQFVVDLFTKKVPVIAEKWLGDSE